jgi:hypothetical protein
MECESCASMKRCVRILKSANLAEVEAGGLLNAGRCTILAVVAGIRQFELALAFTLRG